MPDKTRQRNTTQTGEMRAVPLEGDLRREPPRPDSLPEMGNAEMNNKNDLGATTGSIPIVRSTEGPDDDAIRDSDDAPDMG